MKITLIEPSSQYAAGRKVLRHKRAVIPSLTLPYLAALVPAGIEVSITLDLVDEVDFDDKPDIVGITSYSCQIPRAYAIADEFRRRGVYVVMGGIHVSMETEEALRHADTVVVGEADDLWPAFIRDYRNRTPQKIYRSDSRPSLQGLPVPRFDLLDKYRSRYVALGSGWLSRMLPLTAYPVQTSRGCPHSCDFCSVTLFSGATYRVRPVEEVVAEVKALGARTYLFVDDNILAHPRHAAALFTALIPLRIRWIGQATVSASKNTELIRLARRSGCVMLAVGVESLSRNALRSVHKTMNVVDDYAANIRAYRKAGILILANMIFGFDGESPAVFGEAVRFLVRNRIAYTLWGIVVPYPGTRLLERYRQEGRLRERWWLDPKLAQLWSFRYEPRVADEKNFCKELLRYHRFFVSVPMIFLRMLLFPVSQWFNFLLVNFAFRRKDADETAG